MKKALVYNSALLPVSEVWIKEQIAGLKAWEAVLVGRKKAADGVAIGEIRPVFIDSGTGWVSRKMRSLRYWLGIPRRQDVRLLQKERASLLHIHFGLEAVLVWPLAKTLNIPVLITLHGYDINTYKQWWEAGNAGLKKRLYPARLLKISKQKNVHFLAVSRSIQRRAIEYGIPEEKITLSYLGVDTTKFFPAGRPLKKRTDILFVGRLVEKKGCQYLLEAFRQVQGIYPDIQLVIVGAGRLERELKDYARQYKLRVKFLGALSHEQICEQMHQAKIFCLPSIVARNGDAEGLPVSILEAQSCGVPVITSARGGVEEGIVHGVTGLSLDEKDVAAMVEAIRTLLDDETLLDSMGNSARRHIVETMDIHTCTAELEKIYESVTSR